MSNWSTGTYANHGAPVLTMDAIRAAVAEVESLPRLDTDMTASPDAVAALRAHPEAGALLSDPSAPQLWTDPTLPAGTAHAGKPLLMQAMEDE